VKTERAIAVLSNCVTLFTTKSFVTVLNAGFSRIVDRGLV